MDSCYFFIYWFRKYSIFEEVLFALCTSLFFTFWQELAHIFEKWPLCCLSCEHEHSHRNLLLWRWQRLNRKVDTSSLVVLEWLSPGRKCSTVPSVLERGRVQCLLGSAARRRLASSNMTHLSSCVSFLRPRGLSFEGVFLFSCVLIALLTTQDWRLSTLQGTIIRSEFTYSIDFMILRSLLYQRRKTIFVGPNFTSWGGFCFDDRIAMSCSRSIQLLEPNKIRIFLKLFFLQLQKTRWAFKPQTVFKDTISAFFIRKM